MWPFKKKEVKEDKEVNLIAWECRNLNKSIYRSKQIEVEKYPLGSTVKILIPGQAYGFHATVVEHVNDCQTWYLNVRFATDLGVNWVHPKDVELVGAK